VTLSETMPLSALPSLPHAAALDPVATLHRLCKIRGVAPPQVVDEVCLDLGTGKWQVTFAAAGHVAVGVGQGKKGARKTAAEALLREL
jgi:hypothetical protein